LELVKLRYAFNFNKGLTITKENLQDEGIPCVNYGEVHSKYGFEVDPSRHPLKCVDVSYIKDNSASLLRRGDFVFADTSEDVEGSGNFTYYNSELQAFAGYHTLIAKPKVPMNARFMAYLIDSPSFRAQVQIEVKGVKVFSISQTILKQTMVWFPSPNLQDAIASFLDDKCAKLDVAVQIKQEQIALLRERRQIIIEDAVTRGLNPAAPMKDSGIDWIGQIPAHWEVKRNKHMFIEINERSAKGAEQHLSMSQKLGLVPANLVEKSLVSESYEGAKLVRTGDLVLNRLKAHLAVFSIAPTEGLVSPDYSVFRPFVAGASSRYYESLFKTSKYLGEFRLRVRGIVEGFYRLYTDSFMDIPLLIPPQIEQGEIIDYLDRLSAKFADTVSIKERQIAALKEYKTSLINAAVTGKIKVI